ncbi:MAG: hypothetical protein QNJ81_02150 [Acidimicrobiia bacterium]|nr:hypothetical protein [Acidimicrobiia bacterium]
MKITIKIELGHITNDNGTVTLKDSEDDVICKDETTHECELIVEEIIGSALTDIGIEPATMEVEWDGS